jgi:hypothetical protein
VPGHFRLDFSYLVGIEAHWLYPGLDVHNWSYCIYPLGFRDIEKWRPGSFTAGWILLDASEKPTAD